MATVVLTANFSPWSRYRGGGQLSTHHLASALGRRGHDVHVVFTKPPWEAVEVPVGLPYALHWATLPALRSDRRAALRALSAVSVARAVAAIVRGRRDAIVHGQGDEAALLPELRRGRASFGLVMTPRYPAFPSAMVDGRWRAAAGRRLVTAIRHHRYVALGHALRGADRWCPTSEHAAVATARVFALSEANLRVVPNGINPAFFAAERRRRADAPLVFFGRLCLEKGVMTLLDAYERLGEGAPGLEIVGDGPLADEVARRAAAFGGRIKHVPWLEPPVLARRLAEARLAVLPSWEESFGNAVVEAMSVGVPLVSTTAGSIPELVQPGRTGWLVAPDDPQALSSAITDALADPEAAERMGAEARRIARRSWSWDATAERFERVYDELASPG